MKKVVTLIVCAPLPLAGNEHAILPEAEGKLYAYAALIPHYFLHNKDKYAMVCLTVNFREEYSVENLALRARIDIERYYKDPKVPPLIVVVEDRISEALIMELDAATDANDLCYELIGPNGDIDIPFSRRRIILGQSDPSDPNTFDIVIGDKEIAA